MGVDDGVDLGVGEGRQVELVVDGAAGLRGAAAERQQLGIAE